MIRDDGSASRFDVLSEHDAGVRTIVMSRDIALTVSEDGGLGLIVTRSNELQTIVRNVKIATLSSKRPLPPVTVPPKKNKTEREDDWMTPEVGSMEAGTWKSGTSSGWHERVDMQDDSDDDWGPWKARAFDNEEEAHDWPFDLYNVLSQKHVLFIAATLVADRSL